MQCDENPITALVTVLIGFIVGRALYLLYLDKNETKTVKVNCTCGPEQAKASPQVPTSPQTSHKADASFSGQLNFQTPATEIMEKIVDLHHDLMFFIIVIVVFVS